MVAPGVVGALASRPETPQYLVRSYWFGEEGHHTSYSTGWRKRVLSCDHHGGGRG